MYNCTQHQDYGIPYWGGGKDKSPKGRDLEQGSTRKGCESVQLKDCDHDEERFVTPGMDGLSRVIVVAYHYRGEDEIRVISARLAEPHERRAYIEG
jgi:uncharacterized DUF497 family protein